ncbi:MAG: large conductance mechanosensitive channel protein MscL [Bryobacteraceae bacterium]|nr:large conductance mechanosensitive channel protein MscL [Bryobacteraceae bacterium]
MSMIQEFKAFIQRGNVLDLAVGVIIGGAFGKIVTSVTDDLIMPFVGLLTGGIDFSQRFIALNGGQYESLEAARKAGAVFAYGNFITALINFLIIAFVIFILVKQVNRLLPPPPAPPAGPTPTESLLGEIRDLLARR